MTEIKNIVTRLKKRNRKLKSFTIIELLVTIMLSSLVVLITYTTYDIVTQQYFIKKKFYQEINDITRLHLELQDEFEKSESIRCENDKIYFIKSTVDSICYQFLDNNIVRTKKDFSDSIFLKPVSFKKKFFDKDIETGSINELTFNIIYKKDSFNFAFYKDCAPDIIMRENEEK